MSTTVPGVGLGVGVGVGVAVWVGVGDGDGDDEGDDVGATVGVGVAGDFTGEGDGVGLGVKTAADPWQPAREAAKIATHGASRAREKKGIFKKESPTKIFECMRAMRATNNGRSMSNYRSRWQEGAGTTLAILV